MHCRHILTIFRFLQTRTTMLLDPLVNIFEERCFILQTYNTTVAMHVNTVFPLGVGYLLT